MNALLYGTPMKLADGGRNYRAYTHIDDAVEGIVPEIIEVSSEDFYGSGYEDCDRRIPDVSKARKLLGWTSTHDLDSVLLHTMEYFVKRHKRQAGGPGNTET